MLRILITGGSGFVGSSIVELFTTFKTYNISVSTRKRSNLPIKTQSGLAVNHFYWDVRDATVAKPDFDVIVHAATPASALLNNSDPKEMFKVVVQGMENVIEFASRHQKPPIVLFTSSGAVYGDVPEFIGSVPENWSGAVNPYQPSSAYAEGKRAAEFLLSEASSRGVCKGLLARMFAFSGVDLPMDRHFAIGNFVRDAVRDHTIQVRSDGLSVRSYMDQRDMANWLLRILEVGRTEEIYHVGSERAISIRDLAHLIALRTEVILQLKVTVEIQGLNSSIDGVSRYVPSTLATRTALGVNETISLEESIDAMIHKAIKEYL